jgi:hypothetical protein
MIEASPLGRPTPFLLPVVLDTTDFFGGRPFRFAAVADLSISGLLKVFPLVILRILK